MSHYWAEGLLLSYKWKLNVYNYHVWDAQNKTGLFLNSNIQDEAVITGCRDNRFTHTHTDSHRLFHKLQPTINLSVSGCYETPHTDTHLVNLSPTRINTKQRRTYKSLTMVKMSMIHHFVILICDSSPGTQ